MSIRNFFYRQRPTASDSDRRISRALQNVKPDIWHAAPSPVVEGEIYYADGTDWNPGSGKGYYYYNGTAWIFMGGSGTSNSPLTTTGDVWVYGTTNGDDRLPVGTDQYALVADSSQDLGVGWGLPGVVKRILFDNTVESATFSTTNTTVASFTADKEFSASGYLILASLTARVNGTPSGTSDFILSVQIDTDPVTAVAKGTGSVGTTSTYSCASGVYRNSSSGTGNRTIKLVARSTSETYVVDRCQLLVFEAYNGTY